MILLHKAIARGNHKNAIWNIIISMHAKHSLTELELLHARHQIAS